MRNDQRNATPSEVKDDYEDFLYDERLHSKGYSLSGGGDHTPKKILRVGGPENFAILWVGFHENFLILRVGGKVRPLQVIVYGENSAGGWSKKNCNSAGGWSDKNCDSVGGWSEKSSVVTPTTYCFNGIALSKTQFYRNISLVIILSNHYIYTSHSI